MAAPPTFGGGAGPAGTGGFMASGVRPSGPGDPLTLTNAHLNRPAAPSPSGPAAPPGPLAPYPPGPARPPSPGIPADGRAPGGQRNGHGTPGASSTASATATHKAKASPTARAAKKGSGLRPARLTGTWTGSYVCPQGSTGLRLALKATAGGGLTATFSFYPTGSNVSVPSGSFALTGSYTAKEFQLTPDRWISKPQNYSMVGLTGAASESDTTLSGSVVSPGCTTFSVSR
jgi:hypothetical protein